MWIQSLSFGVVKVCLSNDCWDRGKICKNNLSFWVSKMIEPLSNYKVDNVTELKVKTYTYKRNILLCERVESKSRLNCYWNKKLNFESSYK